MTTAFPPLPGLDERSLTPLTSEEAERYERNLRVEEIGTQGQQRLSAARVLIIGTGGLGSPAAFYLAAAGVGRIGLVDDDVVSLSNLQRQILHSTPRLGELKVESAERTLRDLNPHVEVQTYPQRLTAANAGQLLDGWDLVIDATDNFETRYILSDACVLLGIPLIHGAVIRFYGQITVLSTPSGPCYRCLLPTPPDPAAPDSLPSATEAGVLGAVAGLIGTMQATEAIKLILAQGTPLIGRLQHVDAWSSSTTQLPLMRNPSCPACGDDPLLRSLDDLPLQLPTSD